MKHLAKENLIDVKKKKEKERKEIIIAYEAIAELHQELEVLKAKKLEGGI